MDLPVFENLHFSKSALVFSNLRFITSALSKSALQQICTLASLHLVYLEYWLLTKSEYIPCTM